MPPIHAVDERMPPGRLFSLALQHVLVLCAGAVAVPLIVGAALKLPQDQIAILINADLFAGGVATLVQCLGVWKLGARLPVMMGVSFVSVGPMLAMAAAPDIGLTGIYGGIIAGGLFGMAIAPLVTRLLPYFPPVVSGSIILLLGISIAPIGIRWAGGGIGSPDFGNPANLAIALSVLLVIVALHKWGRGIVRNISVLIGIAFGYGLCLLLGKVSFGDIDAAPMFGLVQPFQFGLPSFHLGAVISMCIVMLVILVESTGMFIAIGDIVERPVDKRTMTRALMADGAGAVFGGIFNTFPYTSFTQNIGLISMTGVRSRYVCAAGGVIMIILGVLPKLAHAVATIPPYVLGGAGIVMFGMVIASGVRMLSEVDFTSNKDNLLIVAISCCVAMIPLAAPTFFGQFPAWLSPITHSGILLGAVTAFSLNLLLNGRTRSAADALAEHGAAMKRSEA
ncbi:nucleobase:cation symporter-2 family protein [Cupriavidus taiwanensis]|uniref:nucleobase:cation symporter-2 family protein n=1 Tax=Cupriavidus taiwanensis TaxID=164546 RepID=UPI0025411AB4|nr:nucleobase:cation symporter-2 family protein [Cupriavidus taiwanensis]MDK3024117.1 nucleobase:cation symporter-2 family protein [Cupriavidus taiwanensis]